MYEVQHAGDVLPVCAAPWGRSAARVPLQEGRSLPQRGPSRSQSSWSVKGSEHLKKSKPLRSGLGFCFRLKGSEFLENLMALRSSPHFCLKGSMLQWLGDLVRQGVSFHGSEILKKSMTL